MRLFLVLWVLAATSASAWADVICRQYHPSDFGTPITSYSAKAFVITDVCDEPKLQLHRPVSLSVRIGHQGRQEAANADTVGVESFPPTPGSTRQKLNSEREISIWTVWFDLNRSELRESSKAVLDEVPTTATVQVTGYACRLGSEQHNMDLSLHRAQAVSVYLQGRGVTVLSKHGLGECCPISADNLALNRRAVIEQVKEKAE